MNEYNFFADLLNKYSQLTPWVQTITALGFCGVVMVIAYFFKESLAVLVKPFERSKDKQNPEINNELLRIEQKD